MVSSIFNIEKFVNRLMTVTSDSLTDDNLEDHSDEILKEEIKTWNNFGEALRLNERKLFFQMLKECQVYESGAAAKGSNMSTESLLMSIIFNQQKIIKNLLNMSDEKKPTG
jgi:hypothetical protein